MQEHELRALLNAHNIPLEDWGKGEAKTFAHLLSELSAGESVLEERGGMLVRVALGSNVYVYYDLNGERLFLKEDKQVFKDGRARVRDLRASIGEKMKPGEDPLESAYRALEEELGIGERLPLIPRLMDGKGPVLSPSFPGLYSIYKMYVFETCLPAHLYKPDGYVEEQADKSTYFVWVKQNC